MNPSVTIMHRNWGEDAEGLLTAQLTFELLDEFTYGYTADVQAEKEYGGSHPAWFFYKGGNIDDIVFNAAGQVDSNGVFKDTDALVRAVELLHAMCLPTRAAVMAAVPNWHRWTTRVMLGAEGNYWFSMKAFLVKFNAVFQYPWSADDGKPMRVQLRLTFRPSFGTYGVATDLPKQLPAAPFKFNPLGGGSK